MNHQMMMGMEMPPSSGMSHHSSVPMAMQTPGPQRTIHVQHPVEGMVVHELGPHDVLLGRGGGTNNYCGNVKFRKLVNEHKMKYLTVSKVEKPNVAREVVAIWRKLNPPGRFLAKQEDPNAKRQQEGSNGSDGGQQQQPPKPRQVWVEVGNQKAREKASQCLRERTPDVLPLIRQMKEQAQQQVTEGKRRVASGSRDSSNDTAQSRTKSKSPRPHSNKSSSNTNEQTLTNPRSRSNSPTDKGDEANSKVRARSKTPGRQSKKVARLDSKAKKQKQGTESSDDIDKAGPDQDGRRQTTGPGPAFMPGGLTPPHTARTMDMCINPMAMNMAPDGMSMMYPSPMMMDKTMMRRNSMPNECTPQHPSSFMNRRGSLPAAMQASMGQMGTQTHHGMAMNMSSFSPNATAMMQMQGMGMGMGPAGAAGMGFGSAAFGNNGTPFGMPGVMPPMSPADAAAFHNGVPFMDPLQAQQFSQHAHPMMGPMQCSMYSVQQQQLKLQQMQMEQNRLRQQLDAQLQMEREMQIQHGMNPSSMGRGMAYDSHAQSQHSNGRGVEAPGFLPNSARGEHIDPLPLDSEERNGDNDNTPQEDIPIPPTYQPPPRGSRGSDPPTAAAVAAGNTNSPSPDDNLGSKLAPAQVSPDIPRDVIPSEITRAVLPTIPQDVHREAVAVAPSNDRERTSDPDGEMTLAEYRRTLDAYVSTNNITITDQIYSDNEGDDHCNEHQGGNDDLMSVRSFGDWRYGHLRASPSRSTMGSVSESRNEDPRPDPPAVGTPGRAPPRIQRVNRQQAGGFRSSFTSLSGMSVLSANGDDRDDVSTTGKGGNKNFSSNESIVSEITVLSHTIDDLGLGDDE
ncbi:expressed unknown protein [Seminavis robusta]|uniref:DUF6824 domain-containing protein n=1 Tax=Seminavis robusta TaxID=568900 RepID=A0A9N8H724_9STRA|nr:expressed unknown protein [Seminavis robusta]|eukprot:Sro117_g057230.1 n/a (847) ;mRNA; f:2214-4837